MHDELWMWPSESLPMACWAKYGVCPPPLKGNGRALNQGMYTSVNSTYCAKMATYFNLVC
jgi:hypothetical protein